MLLGSTTWQSSFANIINNIRKAAGLPPLSSTGYSTYDPYPSATGYKPEWGYNKPKAGEGIQAVDPSQTAWHPNTRVGGTESSPMSMRPGFLYSGPYSQDVTAQTTEDKSGNAFQWMDLNQDHVYNPGEEYDPRSSVWNGWMNQQDAAQNPTTPTSAGIGSVPTNQAQQDYQNATTMADWSGTPLTAEQQAQYQQSAFPKHSWKTERAAGNDWLGDLF